MIAVCTPLTGAEALWVVLYMGESLEGVLEG